MIILKDFITNFNDFFKAFFSNENYINFFGIIVAFVSAYIVARNTILKPQILKIKQLQLNNVYLPLFRLFHDMPSSVTIKDALIYSKKASTILDKDYVLAFPELHSLNSSLKSCIISQQDYNKTLKTMKYKVEVDYELLKRRLGYPSNRLYYTFIRMTLRQKASFIALQFTKLCFLVPVIISFPISSMNPKSSYVIVMYISGFLSIIMVSLNLWAKHLKD